MPKSGTNQNDFNPVSISSESAMPERSAPMLIVFAMKRAKVATAISSLGNLRRNVPSSEIRTLQTENGISQALRGDTRDYQYGPRSTSDGHFFSRSDIASHS